MSTSPLVFRRAEDRAVLRVEGPDAATFLQGLLTNDVRAAGPGRAVYAALLTPQGKYLADMMVWSDGPERFWLDVDATQAPGLLPRLALYKLRAKVALDAPPGARVLLIWGADAGPAVAALAPAPTLLRAPDPRVEGLAWRLLALDPDAAEAASRALEGAGAAGADHALWRRRQIEALAPIAGEDLAPNESFPLEVDFERLHGVDFRKGCYVGQEVTARMKHKAELKKALFRVAIDGPAPAPGAEILADGKPAGRLGASEGGLGLALLRKDRIEGGAALVADGAALRVVAGGESSR